MPPSTRHKNDLARVNDALDGRGVALGTGVVEVEEPLHNGNWCCYVCTVTAGDDTWRDSEGRKQDPAMQGLVTLCSYQIQWVVMNAPINTRCFLN